MPLSASKSTSKREISASAAKQQSSVDSRKKNPPQRSKSASAITRNYTKTPFTWAGGDLSEFLNKRDNPLFCCSNTSSPEDEGGGDGCSTRRGRSVSRSFGYGERTYESRNQSTRSLSRVGSEGRLRAISREHYDYSEREEDPECNEILSLRNDKKDAQEPKFQKNKRAASNGYSMEQRKNLQTWTSRHPVSDYCNTSSSRSWEDGISISSLSELEETTVKEGIWRKNFTDDIVEVGPEMVNQNTLELVADIRMEYETKLKESHERARKLRADLAVEEQREQDISIMLKEIISHENSAPRKSRPRKKLSIERLEMSRRLTEDAMSYFDECVSISTFDSSDFSSTEDQQPYSIGIIPPLYGSRSLTSDVSTCSIPCHLNHPEEVEIQSQFDNSAGSYLAPISSCSSSQGVSFPLIGQKHDKLSNLGELPGGSIEFSSVCEVANNGESHDFRTYIKMFEKDSNRSAKITGVSSRFNINDYDLDNSAESLLLDIVVFKNRIQSGSLLLCDIRTF